MVSMILFFIYFFVKQKTAYELRISDWSSDGALPILIMLTRKQHELLSFINYRVSTSGVSPSCEEMKEALALKSKSGVHRRISALEERGFIHRLPNRARALEVVKMPEPPSVEPSLRADNVLRPDFGKMPASNDVLEIPLHGRIAAGLPIEALEGQSSLSVPAALLGSGEHYALEVSGRSE